MDAFLFVFAHLGITFAWKVICSVYCFGLWFILNVCITVRQNCYTLRRVEINCSVLQFCQYNSQLVGLGTGAGTKLLSLYP